MKTYLFAAVHAVAIAAAIWFLILMLSVIGMQLTHGQIYIGGDDMILIGFLLLVLFLSLNIHRIVNDRPIIRFPI